METIAEIFEGILQDATLFVTMVIVFLIILLSILILMNKSFEKDKKNLILSTVLWTGLSIVISVFLLKGISDFENFTNNNFWFLMTAGVGFYLLATAFAVSEFYKFAAYYQDQKNRLTEPYLDRLGKVTSHLALGSVAFILFLSAIAFLFVLLFGLYVLFFDGTDFLIDGFSDFNFNSYIGFITSIAILFYVLFVGIILSRLNDQMKMQAENISKTADQLDYQRSDLRIKNISDKLRDTKDQIEDYYVPILNLFSSFRTNFNDAAHAVLIPDDKEMKRILDNKWNKLGAITDEIMLCYSTYNYGDASVVRNFESDVFNSGLDEMSRLDAERKQLIEDEEKLEYIKPTIEDVIGTMNEKIDYYQNSVLGEIKEKGIQVNQLRSERDQLITEKYSSDENDS